MAETVTRTEVNTARSSGSDDEANAAQPSPTGRDHHQLASLIFAEVVPLQCQDGRRLYVVVLTCVLECLFREKQLEVAPNWSITNLAGSLARGVPANGAETAGVTWTMWTELYTLLNVEAGAICGVTIAAGLSIPATRALVRAQIVTDMTRAYLCAMSGSEPWSEAWKLPVTLDSPRMQTCIGRARRNGMFAAYRRLLTRDRLEGVNRDLIGAARASTNAAFEAFVLSALAAPGASGFPQPGYCVHAPPTDRVARKRRLYEASSSDPVLQRLASLSQEVHRLNAAMKPLRESNMNLPSASAANARRGSKARLERLQLEQSIYSFLQTNQFALTGLVDHRPHAQAAYEQLQAFMKVP